MFSFRKHSEDYDQKTSFKTLHADDYVLKILQKTTFGRLHSENGSPEDYVQKTNFRRLRSENIQKTTFRLRSEDYVQKSSFCKHS